MSSLGNAITADVASAKSTVDRLSLLQRVILVRFVMDLMELDGDGGSERSVRYREDEG